MLAERIGRPASVSGLFSELTERWDGHGVPERSVGKVIQARAGKALDPAIVRQFAVASGDVVAATDQPAWEAVLDAEPRPWPQLSGDKIDRAPGALGTFSDLASPYLSGHPAGVSDLASRVAQACGVRPCRGDRGTVGSAGARPGRGGSRPGHLG